MSNAPSAAPIPMPAFAPVERVDEDALLLGEGVVGFFVPVGVFVRVAVDLTDVVWPAVAVVESLAGAGASKNSLVVGALQETSPSALVPQHCHSFSVVLNTTSGNGWSSRRLQAR